MSTSSVNSLLSSSGRSAALAAGLLFIITALSANAGSRNYNPVYGKLLQNCVVAINESGFQGHAKSLVRKIDSGSRYKFWIDVAESGDTNVEPQRAYCEGKTRSGEVEVFAMADGEWQSGNWSADTKEVLSGYLADK